MQGFQVMINGLRAATKSIWVILFVALALRLDFMWQYELSHPKQAVSVIPFLFESGNIAHSVAAGHGFSSPFRVDTGPTAWMTPAYPLLLAGIFRLFGVYTFHAWEAAVLANILCCTLACVPLFYRGETDWRGWFGRWRRVAVGHFSECHSDPVESMWDASISALLVAAILWATLALAESERMRDWCAYGLLWGVTLMVNATLAALLPLLLGWVAYRQHLHHRLWARRAAICVIIVILCCVPWTIRNYKVFHLSCSAALRAGVAIVAGKQRSNPGHLPRRTCTPSDNSAEREKYMALWANLPTCAKRGRKPCNTCCRTRRAKACGSSPTDLSRYGRAGLRIR